ncbi:type I methionyl aminopeptidase [Cohnella candidum]|uniref:Methionine aminopeptidase n=1 Tax=Cohnella candidum TaxID=2674991 RepID=A0A3G3JWM7_9BACL|nr:type I methionyl aminopeptidase [Cohnella candidum]AYQ72638.1 type I methionyl aminopeptidase [Cohnella candidum]
MTVGSENDLIALRRIGKIVAMAREEMLKNARAGITTAELDEIGKRVLDRHGAKSAPNQVYGFPGTTCISLNQVAAHGIPGTAKLREGDVVNVDVSAELDGYYADTGATIVVPPSRSALKEKLCASSKRALLKAIGQAKAGTKVNQIGRIIEQEARSDGFHVIRNLSGHGIGKALHEAPDNILNFRDPRDNRLLTNGLVLAVETFLTTGAELVDEADDGWGLVCSDGSFVAQFEHTIVVTRGEPLILTAI